MQSARFVVRASAGDGGVVARRFGAETLLVPVCGGVGDLDSVYTLNPTGTTIWEAIAHPMPFGELVAVLTTEFDVTPEQARDDVDSFLAELAGLGLVQVSGSSGSSQ